MLAKTYTCEVIGLEGHIIEVEVDFSPNAMTAFIVVGLPNTAIQESKERVRSAIKNSHLSFPMKRFVVNLAPADVPKNGNGYDLAMAVGCLAVTDQIPIHKLERALFIGELALDGAVRHVGGILPIAQAAQENGFEYLYVPEEDAYLASFVPQLTVIPVQSLGQLVEHMFDLNPIPPAPHQTQMPHTDSAHLRGVTDISDIKGNEYSKRALEVAAAGNHHVFFIGSPGVGKTLMARALAGILPSLSWEECLEITRIYSAADLLGHEQHLISQRPFRSPHHTISHAGLIGGGSYPKPGEISLAHRGVLFLDELLEFSHKTLESLRQPIEDKKVTISRAKMAITYPSNFMLVGSSNPCPCGYLNDSSRQCTCTHAAIRTYQQRMSGPLLDRMDIYVDVPRVDYDKLTSLAKGETSAQIRERVEKARHIQRQRFANTPHLYSNSDMGVKEVEAFCKTTSAAMQILRASLEKMQLSARAYHRILKLSRTIADLAESDLIDVPHMAEAIQYRPRHILG